MTDLQSFELTGIAGQDNILAQLANRWCCL